MNLKGSTVLVTGAGGFIGSHLVEALVARGARVRAFVRYTSRADDGALALVDRQVMSNVEIVRGDLRDSGAVLEAMDDTSVVFHLGALIGIPYSYVHPREVCDTNVTGTLNVLEAARRVGIERFVHTSTSEVYGTAQTAKIAESHPLHGQSPYAATKIGADALVESYHRTFGVPAVTIRPFNTYGPRQSLRAVIPTIIAQALSRRSIHLGALTPTRDFTYVEDTARGFIQAAMVGARAVAGRTINLGVGREIGIGDLAKRIAHLIGRDIEIVADRGRTRPGKSEVQRLCSENEQARTLLKWSPDVGLDEGLRKTIAWFEANIDRIRPFDYHV